MNSYDEEIVAGNGLLTGGCLSPAGSQPGTDGSGASRTPLEALEGMITPSSLHFERRHACEIV